MSTATEIATKALKRLRVIGAGETASASDIVDATDALNAMIAAFEANTMSGDSTPFDARFEAGIIAMLAVRLAEDYGKTPGPILMRDAREGEQQLTAAFTVVPSSTFDLALQPRKAAAMLLTEDGEDLNESPYSAWRASTNYALRQLRVYNGNLYEVVTAGQSGTSGGPTGTGSSITDGTAVWCFRRVV